MAQRERVAVLEFQHVTLDTVRRYLPGNYEAVELDGRFVVFGRDVAGWTLDEYVLPRLQSGLYFGVEIEGAEAADLYSRAVVVAAGEADEVHGPGSDTTTTRAVIG